MVLFGLVFVASTAWAFFLIRRATRRERTRRGPVPGYSITPGKEVALGVVQSELPLEILSIEEFHSVGRTRLVLTVESDSPAIDGLLPVIARDLQERSHARVIVVERLRTDGDRLRHMFAPDGHGWTGQEAITEATA